MNTFRFVVLAMAPLLLLGCTVERVHIDDDRTVPHGDAGAPCVTDDDCQDLKFCSGHEVCIQSVCYPGPGVDLLDNLQCTDDVCDPATGVITHPPVKADDGDPCTIDGCTEGIGIWHAPSMAAGCPVPTNLLSEADACEMLSNKMSSLLAAMGCSATLHACPELMLYLGSEPCSTYDPGTVGGCIHIYEAQSSCAALISAIKSCQPVSYPPPGGCP